MTWWQAILLGALQGITEFLPVSSSGHLVLLQQWWQVSGEESAAALFFDGMLHLGTVFSVLVYFWRDRISAVASRRASLVRSKVNEGASANTEEVQRCVQTYPPVARLRASANTEEVQPNISVASSKANSADNHLPAGDEISWWRWLWLLGWASAPAALAVLAFPRWIRDSFVSVPMVAVDFILLGILLWLTDRLPSGQVGALQTRWYHAVITGIGQMLSALFRGLSRSGMTISTALFLGLERTWAVRLSFAMSVIANLGLAALGLLHVVRGCSTASWFTPAFITCSIVGTVTSAVVGYLSIYPLLALVQRCRLRWFSLYLWLVGGAAGLWSAFS